MNHPQASGAVQVTASDPTSLTTNTGPSLQRASILVVASVSSFSGASLWLAECVDKVGIQTGWTAMQLALLGLGL